MDSNKTSERTSSSSGEPPQREKTRNEKSHQKITFPTIDKRSIQEAKLWWRIFTQYIKITQTIDLNQITTNREILEQYRKDLDIRIKDLFLWEVGESAITEMTRTVKDNDLNKMDNFWLHSLHCFDYTFSPNEMNFTAGPNSPV